MTVASSMAAGSVTNHQVVWKHCLHKSHVCVCGGGGGGALVSMSVCASVSAHTRVCVCMACEEYIYISIVASLY